jgi:hypothetical protein
MRYTVTTGFAFNKYTTRRTSPAPLLLLPQALPRPTPQHPTPRTFAQRSTTIQSDSVPHFKRLSRHDSASHRPDYNDPTGHSTYNLRIGMDDGPAPPGAAPSRTRTSCRGRRTNNARTYARYHDGATVTASTYISSRVLLYTCMATHLDSSTILTNPTR